MTRALRFTPLLLALVMAPARADVVLDGYQHIGDNESVTFTPSDPVGLNEFLSSDSRFHLSQSITVTAVRLENFVQGNPAPLSSSQPFRVVLDNSNRSGTYSSGTLTLSTPRTLGAGVHLIAIDPGCLRGGAQSFGSNCRRADDEFDIGFSAITLVTADATQITLSRNLNRRRHLGDTTDFSNDNFGGRYYPDAAEGVTLDIPFTLDRNLRLNEVRLYRLRDVASGSQVLSRGTLSIVNTGTGTVDTIGSLTRDGNPYSLSSSLSLPSGNYAVRVSAGQMKNPTSDQDKIRDDLRWNDILLLFGIDPTATVGRFNAVDPDQDPVIGIVRTKVAGNPLDVDITAIANGALLTSHTGDVEIKLLDASDDSGSLNSYGCRTSWPEREDLGSLTFVLADGGRKRLPAEVANAYPRARLLVTDPVLAISGCSTDVFAVRPSTFTLAVTHGDWETAGTATALNNLDAGVAAPVHKAGRPFTIRATALNADGAVTTLYSGSPTVLALTSLLGATVGEARADLWIATSGVAQADNARYNEVGAFQLEVTDTTFASVDAGDPGADRNVGPVTIDVGRFVPDHFEVSLNTPEFLPGCGSFTYVGQRFQYFIAPVATLTASAFAAPPTTTTNYTGLQLFKLPAALAQSGYEARDPATGTASDELLDLSGLPATDTEVLDAGAGVATVTLTGASGATGFAYLRTTPVVAFDAEIAVTLGAVIDSEGITTAAPVVFGGTDTGTGVAFLAGGNDIRFGRLVVDNAHGSERLPLEVPLRTEYWETLAGSTGFIASVGDACTHTFLNPGDVALVRDPVALATNATAVTGPLGSGGGRITLSAPNDTGFATVKPNLSAALLLHLRGDWDGDGEDDDDPSGRASFGVHRNEARRIYQREVIGN